MPVKYAMGRIVLLLSVLAGCGSGGQVKSSGMQVDTIGDTIVIKSIGSGAWGDSVTLVEEVRIGEVDGAEEYVFGAIADVLPDAHGILHVLDYQAHTIRRYSPDGKYLGSIGGAGSGPGELAGYASGMAFLPDGRLIVRDFQNNRINIYAPDGQPAGQLPIPEGFSTSSALRVDSEGHIYTEAIFERTNDGIKDRTGMLKLDLNGTVLDSISNPFTGFETPKLVATRSDKYGRGMSVRKLPYAPESHWFIDHSARIGGGVSNRYAIDVYGFDGRVHRITREIVPVPVQAGEKAAHQEIIIRGLRQLDPSWRWSGPAIPDTKPYFRHIEVAADGRLWVMLSQPGVKLPPDPEAKSDASGLPPLERWIEPSVFDVFETDGRFLGTVRVPDRTWLRYMRGDQVWAVQWDENDVAYVVRYRIKNTE